MTAGPPPRPSTARLTAPPIAARRSLSRPRVITVSSWLWWVASVLGVATSALALTRLDTVRAELAGVAREANPTATAAKVDQAVHLSVLVIVGGGLLLGAAGVLVALALRARKGWSRVVLITLTLMACTYGVFVVDATGWLVLAYAAVTVVAAVCMYLPGSGGWFG